MLAAAVSKRVRSAFLLPLMLSGCFRLAEAQIVFEPGYFIGPDGTRSNCLILNADWKSNPKTFEYRLNDTDGKGDIETISEFGITAGSIFRRFTVGIDRSTSDINALTTFREPDFKQETLFLRLLVSGKAVLYMYEDHGFVRFFYSVDGSAVSQLVYKRFMQTGERGFETGYVAENQQYKQDLFNRLKCASITQGDVGKLKYERAVLMKFFDRYNECTGTAVKTNEVEEPKTRTQFSLLVGAGFNNCSYYNGYTNVEFETAIAMRFGAEIEFVLPFNKGMWSVTLQPVYQSYSSKTPGTTKIDYNSLDLGAGGRRYLFIRGKNSLYVSAGLVYGLVTHGVITYPTFPPTGSLSGGFNISSGLNPVVGVGYRVSRFSAELSYGFPRRILDDYNGNGFTSSYSGVIFMLGYRLK